MPRTNINPQVLAKFPATGIISALSLDIAFTAADITNGNSFQSSGRDLVLVTNADVVPHTFTIGSIPDNFGRLGNVGPYTVGPQVTSGSPPVMVGPGVTSMFLIDNQALYAFNDGVHLDASDAHILFAILKV